MTRLGEQFGLGKTTIIQLFVAGYYGVPVSQFLSEAGGRSYARPRQVAMYLTRKITNQTLPQIGRRFNRDHTTVLHALRAIEDRMECNPTLAAEVAELKAGLEG